MIVFIFDIVNNLIVIKLITIMIAVEKKRKFKGLSKQMRMGRPGNYLHRDQVLVDPFMCKKNWQTKLQWTVHVPRATWFKLYRWWYMQKVSSCWRKKASDGIGMIKEEEWDVCFGLSDDMITQVIYDGRRVLSHKLRWEQTLPQILHYSMACLHGLMELIRIYLNNTELLMIIGMLY